jgi:hypothetical protein
MRNEGYATATEDKSKAAPHLLDILLLYDHMVFGRDTFAKASEYKKL